MGAETTKRWNELDFYKEGQTLYGRDEEVYSISNGIIRNIQTTIYGQSGVGKSSLLFAGVFPILRKKRFFPVFIRLGHISLEDDYIKVIKEEVLREAEIELICFGKPALVCTPILEKTIERDDLWHFFHTYEFTDKDNNIYIPALIFDQFEEVLSNKKTHEKAKNLLLDLYTLLDNSRIVPEHYIQFTNYRIVMSLREDYLYYLEELIDKYNLSEFRYNRHRVKWLDEHNAKTVIKKTFDQSLNCEDVDDICNIIIKKATDESGDISTICLSLICSILDSKCNGQIIKIKYLNDMEDYIYKYYNQKMGVVSYKAKKYLEEHLITPDGRRNSIDYKDAKRNGPITENELKELISIRLLRLVSITGNSRVEYIHDIIPKLISPKKHNWWYYVKKTFKERHNLIGKASEAECYASSLFFTFFFTIYILALIAFGFSCFINLELPGNKGLWTLIIGAIGIYHCKVFISLCVRQAHDAGISGWKTSILKGIHRWNYESEGFSYIPQISYYYIKAPSIANDLFGKSCNDSQVYKIAINKNEFIAATLKGIKYLIWEILFLVSFVIGINDFTRDIFLGDINDYIEIIFIYILILLAIPFSFMYFSISFLKRINYLNINPYLGLVPLYNFFLLSKCLKTDDSNAKVYTYNWHVIIILSSFMALIPMLTIIFAMAFYFALKIPPFVFY